mmetsp:Transcript_12170/g.13938  ORF Transcript_12170/g.13938 Transcript_12170/m.13938 type:complete len:91 (+) Transcript_12170:76-348(+)
MIVLASSLCQQKFGRQRHTIHRIQYHKFVFQYILIFERYYTSNNKIQLIHIKYNDDYVSLRDAAAGISSTICGCRTHTTRKSGDEVELSV